MKSDFFTRISLRHDVHRKFEEMFLLYMPAAAVVYDVGCGKKPFEKFLKDRVKSHIGVDLADGFYKPDKVDVIGTAYAVPAPNGSADAVISSQVIEHLDKPLLAIDEAHRLLRENGIMFLSFPFLFPLHAEPHDYLRYTHFYLEKEMAAGKFEVLTIAKFGGFWYFLGMCMDMYLQNFDRGFLKKLHIIAAIMYLSSFIFRCVHAFEGWLIGLIKRDVSSYRSRWTANYLVVLKKIPA